MKIFVESMTEHTVAERVHIPRLDGAERQITGERRQAAEVIVRAVIEDSGDIDTWREQVGRTLAVVPWEQEEWNGDVRPPLLPTHYDVSFTQDGHVVLLCNHCGTASADVVHEWGDEHQAMIPIPSVVAAAFAHEKEHHG